MFVGKRQQRPPIKRTTSMRKVTFDLNTTTNPVEGGGGGGGAQPFDPHNPFASVTQKAENGQDQHKSTTLASAAVAVGSVSSRSGRRHSADFAGTTHFLTTCALCKRRLIPGRDIYMYRGDSAFCSLECRQQKMKEDERKEKGKWSVAPKMEVVNTAAGSEGPTKGETVVAL